MSKDSKKRKELIPVFIEWEDAEGGDGDVSDKKARKAIKPRLMHLSGFLIQATKDHIMVGYEWDGFSKTWRGSETVPRGMVRRFLKFKPIKL